MRISDIHCGLATLATLACLVLAVEGGCNRDDKQAAAPASQPADAPSTQATTNPAAGGFVVPRVGVPLVTRDQYKPVIGKYGGRIVRDTLGEPKSFNPVTAAETSTTEFTDRMFEGLTTEDPWTGEWKPLLAESWDVSSDELIWTFKLRKDVLFNDGTPLTARDVEFSWNELVYDQSRPAGSDPRWPCSMRDIVTFNGKPVKVEALDDSTVRFTLSEKIAIFDQLVGYPVLSKAKYAPLAGSGSFGSAMSADSKPEDIVGTGPFMLGEYRRGEKVVLKRNPHYWKKGPAGNPLPYLDELVFTIAKDLNIQYLDFDRGITDAYGLRSGKDVRELKPKQDSGNFTLYQLGPAGGAEFVCFNLNEDAAKAGKVTDYKVKWFRDPRFRKAVSHAIDRGSLVRNVLTNLGYPLAAHYTLASGFFRYPEFKPYDFDLKKSQALLADMGLKKPDGGEYLQDADGHRVSFTINTNSENTLRVEQADFIRSDLKKIGMDVNVLPLSFNLLVQKTDASFDWECLVFGLTGSRDPHWGTNIWKSNARLHLWWPDQKTPSFDWEKRVDEIFEAGIHEMDKEKRKGLYREWISILYEQQPLVYTTTTERVVAIRRKFGNLFPSPSPSRNAAFHNEEEIFDLGATQAAPPAAAASSAASRFAMNARETAR